MIEMKFFPLLMSKSDDDLVSFTNEKICQSKNDFSRIIIVGSTAEAITGRFDFAQLRQSYFAC